MIYGSGDIYEGEFENGKEHGNGTFRWKNGNVYEGEFVESKRHGWGKMVWASGNTYEGQWVEGKKQGKVSYTCLKIQQITYAIFLTVSFFQRENLYIPLGECMMVTGRMMNESTAKWNGLLGMSMRESFRERKISLDNWRCVTQCVD